MTNDVFTNIYKALGSEKDITTNTTYAHNPYITQNYQMLIGRHSKDKVTCSEFVADVLGYSEPEKYSPKDIYNKIKR